MKGTDKYLIVLVIGILLVTVVAVVVVAQRPGLERYQPDNTPEGVVFNYLLALQQSDYERAYGYLSPDLPRGPADVEQMVDDLGWQLNGLQDSQNHPSLSIDTSRAVGDTAVVTVGETHYYRGDLLSSGHTTSTFDAKVRKVEGAWKIVYSQDYWKQDWSSQRDR